MCGGESYEKEFDGKECVKDHSKVYVASSVVSQYRESILILGSQS